MIRKISPFFACLLLLSAPAFGLDEKKLVDMTYPFDENTHHWPTAKPFHLDKIHEGVTGAGFWYASYAYCASEHVGTHMDAPYHFALGRQTADRVPLEKLIGPAVVIDVSQSTAANPDYELQVHDIREWERSYGHIPEGAIVLMRSGWGKFWGDREKYFGTDKEGDTADLHFPGVSKAAALFLTKERQIDAIGADTPSIDHGPSQDFIVHQIFGSADIPIFENVANMSRLPPEGATVFALPMKIKGGTGGPLRIFALLP